jgi:hypothetical protein
MSDRELLELAAKAAGINVKPFAIKPAEGEGDGFIGFMAEGSPRGWWDPLTDDGDALRLAVKLRISITMSEYGRVVCRAGEWTRSIEPYGDDPQAAVRRAITCAAAAISKATMPEQTSTGARKGED